MYLKTLLFSLLPVPALFAITTATPISHIDSSIANTRVKYYAALPIASSSHHIQTRASLTKRNVPWTQLGEGWLGATVDFLPVLPGPFAFTALTKLYTTVAQSCLTGMLHGNRTPTKHLIIEIGALKFIAEATETMEWEVIYQFALKMRAMVDREMASMYTIMFTHVAGQAMMFSIRVAGMDGGPIQ